MAPSRLFSNFDLLVSAGDAAHYMIRVLSTPHSGESAVPELAPTKTLYELNAQVVAWRDLELDQIGGRSLGAALMTWLFHGSVMDLYRVSRGSLGTEEGLRIRLRIEPPELHSLPWECCYDTERDVFVAQDPETPMVRYLPGPYSRSRLASRFLRILVAVASPNILPSLDADAEYARIEEALDDLRGCVEISRTNATIDALQDALRKGPNLLHFIGHGGFSLDKGGYLVLQDDQGRPREVDAEVVAGLLRGSSVQLAILNSCEGARTDLTRGFAGLAPRLIQAGLPAVIAMQTYLPDTVATRFSRALYGAIADRWPLDAAIGVSRQALFAYAPTGLAWSVPALYLTAPDGILWEREEAGASDVSIPEKVGVPASFQFNFQGPVSINAEVFGGTQHVIRDHSAPLTDCRT